MATVILEDSALKEVEAFVRQLPLGPCLVTVNEAGVTITILGESTITTDQIRALLDEQRFAGFSLAFRPDFAIPRLRRTAPST